jgi:hypothetical protein
MAKASEKKSISIAKAPKEKKAAKKETPNTTALIEKACVSALAKLKSLNIEPQLQADIEWCLGSYSHDRNPIGLYEMAERTLEVFKAELEKKTKGVTAKLVTDLEKAVKSRE